MKRLYWKEFLSYPITTRNETVLFSGYSRYGGLHL